MANSSPGAMIVDQDEEGDGTNLLAVAWRSRWLILLFTILGGAGGWAYLQRVVPRYTSTARVYVEQSIPRLLNIDASANGFSSKYLYTQAELIRSAPVLAAAVEAPGNDSLETLRQVDNPVALLIKELKVSVGDRDDLLYLSIELPNRIDAAQIVNSVVDAYITTYSERRKSSSVDVLEILRKEKYRSDQDLEQRRKDLEQFRADHVALAVQTSDDNVVTELFSALSRELNQAQIDLIEAKARYNRAAGMLENPDQLPYLTTMAESEHNGRQGANLEDQIQSVEQALIAQKAKWGEGYPAVKLLSESLASLRARFETQQAAIVTAYVDNLRQSYELLVQRRDELQRAYDKQFKLATDVSAQAAQLASLKEAFNRTEQYCDLIDERMREVNLNDEVGAINVSIVDSAAPGIETYPERPKVLSMALAFGAMLGFGLAWLRDLLDQRLKSVDEIASVMQLPVIGALPILPGMRGGSAGGRSEGGRIVATHPRSPAAEAVRTLRTALDFGLAGPGSKVFVVTSPAPGDGKSTVASNLAITMAQANQRVLIIDSDLRKPTQSEIFDVQADTGLSAVLTGTLAPAEAIVPTGIPSLDIMACGKRPSNPVELLNNGVLPEVLRSLSEHYDKIVIDSPPVMPVADARIIAAMGDCTVLVLRADRSTRRLSVAARDELLKVRTQRLGLVVNAAPLHRSGYGYGYGAYGAYGEYGQAPHADEESESPRPSRKSLRSLSAKAAASPVDA